MGSGLIWANLGKGIADAGATYSNAVGRAAELQWKTDEEERQFNRRMDLEDKRYTNQLKQKLEMEDRRAEELKQRVISEIRQASEMAGQTATARQAAQFETDASRLAGISSQEGGKSPATSKEEFAKLMQENPQYREIYRQAGYIDKAPTANQQRLQQAEDQYNAALSVGAHSSTLESLDKQRSRVLDQIKEENRTAEQTRRDQRAAEDRAAADRRFEALLPIRQQQADAATTNANRPRTSGSSDPNKPATTADIQRQVTAAENQLATELGVARKDVNAEIKVLRKRADSGNAQAKATLDRITPMINEMNSANQRMLEFKRAPSAGSSAGSGTSRPPLSSFKQ